jgi:hypothetical protein
VQAEGIKKRDQERERHDTHSFLGLRPFFPTRKGAWSQVQEHERSNRTMADNTKFGVVTPAPKVNPEKDNVGEKPHRVFHERTGQNLWDIPALRRIFSDLKKKEIAQAQTRKTVKA